MMGAVKTIGCWLVLGVGVFCVACGGSGESSSSAGGGGTGGATASGGTGGTTASGGTGGTTASGGTGGSAPAENVYVNAIADLANLADCQPVAPAANEDGTYAVTIFGPFPKPFTLEGFTFAAADGADKALITDPWMASVVVVPAGGDPTAIDPSATAAPRTPLTVLDSAADDPVTVKILGVTLDAPIAVNASERVVVSLRNTVGPPPSVLYMCGASEHQESNQWWNLGGTMDTMASYGATFDHDWWVSLVPAAK